MLTQPACLISGPASLSRAGAGKGTVTPPTAFLVPLGSGRGESDTTVRIDISPPREYRSTAGIWTFEDLGSRRAVKAELTPREREVAAQVMRGLTSKEIGKALGISHRTVELHRARLMRKYAAATTAELVQKLIAG